MNGGSKKCSMMVLRIVSDKKCLVSQLFSIKLIKYFDLGILPCLRAGKSTKTCAVSPIYSLVFSPVDFAVV